jgi:hypothetical protein
MFLSLNNIFMSVVYVKHRDKYKKKGIDGRKKSIRTRKGKEKAQYIVSVLNYGCVARAVCLWFVSKYLSEMTRHVQALCDSL